MQSFGPSSPDSQSVNSELAVRRDGLKALERKKWPKYLELSKIMLIFAPSIMLNAKL